MGCPTPATLDFRELVLKRERFQNVLLISKKLSELIPVVLNTCGGSIGRELDAVDDVAALLLIELDNLAMVLIGPACIVAASLMSPRAFYGGR